MIQVKERPILFSTPMIRAILSGQKTQTRRAIKLPKDCSWDEQLGGENKGYFSNNKGAGYWHVEEMFCKYGKPGDRLWVRETFCWSGHASDPEEVLYRADQEYTLEDRCDLPWKPSIFMPRWASRITLEITKVGVERLNDISEEDAKAEGLKYHPLYKEWGGVETHPASRPNCPQWRWYEKPSEAFKYLWESINGAGSWEQNPWVWVIEYKIIQEAA